MKENTALVLLNLGVLALTGLALYITGSLWSLLILCFLFVKDN